jgi:cytochrome c oxidase subunit 4
MSNHTGTAHAEHHPSAKLYIGVLVALVVLTVITVLAAGVNFGSPSINVVIALTIATIKASLVALFFMHLLYDKPMNTLIFLSGVMFLGVFLGFCLIDVNAIQEIVPANAKVPLAVAAPGTPGAPSSAPAAAVPGAAASTAAPAAAPPAAEHH